MSQAIRTVYVVHHSHTDIGYTDLQERVIQMQVNYIRSAIALTTDPRRPDFRWNCETLFCVERFWQDATAGEREIFLSLVKSGRMGLSANYLNFTDLVDSGVLQARLLEWKALFDSHGIPMETAMTADINGLSMGQRDAMLSCGVRFLFTNIHTHHGMYPLYQNQNAFFWEAKNGERMLVWNGEHYNLGNVLGIRPNRTRNFMMQDRLAEDGAPKDDADTLKAHLDAYCAECLDNGYPYDFLITAVSGVFSDNAPPEPLILQTIQEYQARYPDAVSIRMVSLQELYAAIKDKLKDSPVYCGDFTDWWANGIGSAPYPAKHYREAQRLYQLCQRLDPQADKHYPKLARDAQDNLLLYAEHTYGHSSTVTCPFDTMVLNLDMRKNSYASKAHEAAAQMLCGISQAQGDLLRYYSTRGKIEVCHTGKLAGKQLVRFYIETMLMPSAQITDEQGNTIPCQVSPHPRGRMITFVDHFTPMQRKQYTYQEQPARPALMNTRTAYVGSERIRDIVNEYDPVSYRLPYEFENSYFRLCYSPQAGITDFVDKRSGRHLLYEGTVPFFTPIYERTPVDTDDSAVSNRQEHARRIIGRNIRGKQARCYAGELKEITVAETGPLFTTLRLRYALEGTTHSDVYLTFYEQLPRIDFKLRLGKTISMDIESVFLPLSLNCGDAELFLRKGSEAFRPGIDQIPGTCMEYYASDDGIAYVSPAGSTLISCHDVPLCYMGELKHHPILLCDNKAANNRRPVYSWIMNNTWETNFKMDLSGFCEFQYTLRLSDAADGEQAMEALAESRTDPHVLITA